MQDVTPHVHLVRDFPQASGTADMPKPPSRTETLPAVRGPTDKNEPKAKRHEKQAEPLNSKKFVPAVSSSTGSSSSSTSTSARPRRPYKTRKHRAFEARLLIYDYDIVRRTRSGVTRHKLSDIQRKYSEAADVRRQRFAMRSVDSTTTKIDAINDQEPRST